MIDECSELVKQAKAAVNLDPRRAVELYKQVAKCLGNDRKDKELYLGKAAKLLRETAKSTSDPAEAFRYYEQSSSIYSIIGKEQDAKKVIQEAQHKFISSAKLLKSEGKKLEDIYLAEQKFRRASEYALLGKDELLSNECWIDSADQFRKVAKNMVDPREADELFRHAIFNYRKGDNQKGETKSLLDSAVKYDQEANGLFKSKKNLVFAFDSYMQAATIYAQINSNDKAIFSGTRVDEISETIGIPKNVLVNFVMRQQVGSFPYVDFTLPPRKKVKHDIGVTEVASTDFTDYEVVEVPIILEKNETPIPKPVFKIKPIAEILNDNNLETDFSKSIKERRREELRQGVLSSSDDFVMEPEKTNEIENLFNEALTDSIESVFPGPEFPAMSEIKQNQNTSEQSPTIPKTVEMTVSNELSLDQVNTISSIQSTPVVEDVTVEAPILSDVITNNTQNPTGVISAPIIDILKFQGYLDDVSAPIEELFQIPEYRVLSLIIQEHPISLDQIEKRTGLETISLVLSNLQADELITQTSDIQWTISEKVRRNMI